MDTYIKMSILSATQEMWLKTEPGSEVANPREYKRVRKKRNKERKWKNTLFIGD